MSKGLNCVICGVGGQGNVLASRLIAQVLLARDEHVKTAETIGMAQRGGSVVSHVRGGHPQSPLVPQHMADCLIAFEPGEAIRNIEFLKPEGTAIINKQAVQPPTAALQNLSYDGKDERVWLENYSEIHAIEIDGAAICNELGSSKCLNVVLLAAATKSGALGISREELELAIKEKVKPAFHELNLKAIARVYNE